MEDLIHRLRQMQGAAKLVGGASVFLRAIEQLPAIARSEAAVVITGETGTGKELVARAMPHDHRKVGGEFVERSSRKFPVHVMVVAPGDEWLRLVGMFA